MLTTDTLFKSKIGRRFFTLFTLVAILPVFLLALHSYNIVTEQLTQQTIRALYKSSKSLGMGIHQRLNFLETEIGIQLNKRDSIDQLILYNFEDDVGRRLKRKFKSLAWFDPEGSVTSIHGQFETSMIENITENLPTGSQFFQLKEHFDSFGHNHLLAIGVYNSNDNKKMYLIGDIDTDFLWRTDILASDETSCIFNSQFKMLYCTKLNGEEFNQAFKDNKNTPNNGHFVWHHQGEKYISNSWEIFLGEHELVENWTVVLSKSQSSTFSSLNIFKNTFVTITLLIFTLIALLSVKYINNILRPLQKLKEGAIRLSSRDFSTPIKLTTNDEISELANTFNQMSKELDKQFTDLDLLSSIDSIILSAAETELISKQLMSIVLERLKADVISIVVFDEFSKNEYLYTLISKKGAFTEKSEITLPDLEKKYFKDNPKGMMLDPAHSHFDLFKVLNSKKHQTAFVFPIIIDDKLAAVSMLAYSKNMEEHDVTIEKARTWVDKLGIALTKSAWQEKLYHQAHYDQLTKLPNRIALQDFLHNAMLQSKSFNTSLSVLFVDLDRFKLINDSLGHLVGDKYLQIISERISSCVKSTDMVSRFGGDEFTIVLTNLGEGEDITKRINIVALRILEAVAKTIVVDGRELFSTCSIGSVVYPNDADTMDDLLKNADSAMYHAKELGGNTIQYFAESMNLSIQKRLRIETFLRKAVDNDELLIYLQPQMDAKTLKVIGAEALVRWDSPDMGMLPPFEFIPIAEQTDLICNIDLWVFEKTLSQFSKWTKRNKILDNISMNFSAKLIQHPDIVSKVWNILNEYKIDASKITIEITESALIQNFEKTVSNMQALIKLGLSFAIDDFGTGYSSLTYLKSLPIKKLKIDQSFVFKLNSSKSDLAIVKSTVSLCRDLDIISIAEGVETESHQELLQQLGCDQLQGYLFSRPIPVDEFEDKFL